MVNLTADNDFKFSLRTPELEHLRISSAQIGFLFVANL